MSLFKPKYTYKGKRIASKVWYIKFTDHNGIVRRIPGVSNKSVALRAERMIRDIVDFRRLNIKQHKGLQNSVCFLNQG